ncbi:MAG: hypothetical protein ACKOFH_13145, partial [Chthoniobacterales bacterium]
MKDGMVDLEEGRPGEVFGADSKAHLGIYAKSQCAGGPGVSAGIDEHLHAGLDDQALLRFGEPSSGRHLGIFGSFVVGPD